MVPILDPVVVDTWHSSQVLALPHLTVEPVHGQQARSAPPCAWKVSHTPVPMSLTKLHTMLLQVSFISGIPVDIHVNGESIPSVEINFLCIHKKLRSKRLAPLLIKEVTRRVNLHGIWQAAYTAGVVLPKPVATCRYWHRSINPKKLVDVGFSHLSARNTMARLVKLNRLPEKPQTPGVPLPLTSLRLASQRPCNPGASSATAASMHGMTHHVHQFARPSCHSRLVLLRSVAQVSRRST